MATHTGRSIPNTEDHHQLHQYHHSSNSSVSNLSKLIDVELDLLKESFEEAKRRIDPMIAQINQARKKFNQILQQGRGGGEMMMERELRVLKQTTSKLKSVIPFNLITPPVEDQLGPNVNLQPPTRPHSNTLTVDDEVVENHPPTTHDFNQCRALFESGILWCFLAFPEGAFIKASLLCSYVNATVFARVNGKFHSLEIVLSMARYLVSKGFVKSIYKKHSSTTVYGFSMDPLVRHALKDHLSSLNREVYHVLRSFVASCSINGENIIYGGSAEPSTLPPNLQFLHLGKWQRSPTHHIEMPDPNLFFKTIGPFRGLTYISFRGVSVMKELPNFITYLADQNDSSNGLKLCSLSILDLKACHHLEVIPSDIGNLCRSLEHLDMSECYFLDHMPASLSRLTRLRVLKGFFVGETNNGEGSCALQDLSSFRWLIKLHIYTSLKTFPSEDHFTTLKGFEDLRNLTICWGGCPSRKENPQSRPKKTPTIPFERLVTHNSDPVVEVKKTSFKLDKLDLRGAPENGTTNWLRPSYFEKLDKLYIRGGQLSGLRHNNEAQKGNQLAAVKDNGWSVKVLRLRHLSKLEMDWNELQNSFPNVVSLEKVNCPNLTSFPCDDDGLWTKDTKNQLQPPFSRN